MRLILVGSASERDRLRAQVNGTAEIVAEFATLSAARGTGVEADAVLVARRSNHPPRPDDEMIEPLTPREVQVLELLAEGLPNKAIAARLGISDQTVKFHVAAIAGKLGAANRTDAVRLAVRRGLITL